MHPDLLLCLKSLNRAVYLVTEEEDRAIREIHDAMTSNEKNKAKVFVYTHPFGLIESSQLLANWQTRSLGNSTQGGPVEAFTKIYTDDSTDKKHFYIITDPERWLHETNNPAGYRLMLNIIHQLRSDTRTIKCLIFISSRLYLPSRLQRYVQVIRDNPLSEEEISEYLASVSKDLAIGGSSGDPIPPGSARWFQGMTSYEIESAVAQSIVLTKTDPKNPKRLDRGIVQDFRRRRINSTELLKYVDVSDTDFTKVGGIDRFKKWVEETKASWTPAGKTFGLKPPKGVLCVGVWGCGKSLSVKAMGNQWKLPVYLLELGKLRSSGVGDTEAAAYKVISYLEALAPCIAWVDEAEKSMAGAASSSFSDSGTTARTLGILSTWHQETKAEVCLAMTANSLRTLPVEFANRIEDKFFFDLPDEDSRVSILKIQLREETTLTPADIKGFPLRQLAEAAEGLVPREMGQAVRTALRRSFHENKPNLDADILEAEFMTRPRIVNTMSDELKDVLDWVGWDKKLKEGIRARFASEKQSTSTLAILEGGST